VPKLLVEPHRQQTLAMMMCEGWSVADICSAMNLPEDTVKKYGSKEAPEGFTKILTAYRHQYERYSVERRFRLAEHAEQAYSNIKEAMLSNDVKLKTETAWRVLDEVSPKQVEETAPGVNVNVSLTKNHHVNTQIAQLGHDLLDEFTKLQKLPEDSYQKHLKTGEDALPSSYKAVQHEEAVGKDIPVWKSTEEEPDVLEGLPSEQTQ
jgi:hypothetical protein